MEKFKVTKRFEQHFTATAFVEAETFEDALELAKHLELEDCDVKTDVLVEHIPPSIKLLD